MTIISNPLMISSIQRITPLKNSRETLHPEYVKKPKEDSFAQTFQDVLRRNLGTD